ncbi:DNA-binding proteins Bright/BRCAA1/RBP1 and proteins containing BRIGHT domain [Ascosphaera aggregata]|nr:DNA-binding proteins Bright/BRCAA1/RBP1 and proteins containing BRIGHT domain [Ascosphaera aggregata]
MSRLSTSTLAMALAGSGASDAAPVPAALASGGMPLPLHDSKLRSNNFSTITTANNCKTLFMDIPKSRRSHGKPLATKTNVGGLPTPPSSVSPTLHPLSQERETYQKTGAAIAAADVFSNPPPTQKSQSRQNGKDNGFEMAIGNGKVTGDQAKSSLSSASQRDMDSNLDLREAAGHAHAQNQPPYRHRHLLPRHHSSQHPQQQHVLSETTLASLAAYHIPEVLLKEGPLAIRHIVERLSQRIPGFSRIPPAKARQIVAAALEQSEPGRIRKPQQRGTMFTKVNASGSDAGTALEGVTPISRTQVDDQSQSEGSACDSSGSSPVAKGRSRRNRYSSITTLAELASTAFSNSGTPVMGCLKDRCSAVMDDYKMSSTYCYDDIVMDDVDDKSEKHDRGLIGDDDDDDDLNMDWNEADDMTDEEDWAQIGADALLARSYGMSPPAHMMTSTSVPTPRTTGMGVAGRSGIVPLQAQQAIAQYQSASAIFVNANRRVNQHESLSVAGRVSREDRSYDSGYGGSSFDPSILAKSLPTATVAKGLSPLSTLTLGPEQREQLAGSGPEERAAIEALLRLGSTPV